MHAVPVRPAAGSVAAIAVVAAVALSACSSSGGGTAGSPAGSPAGSSAAPAGSSAADPGGSSAQAAASDYPALLIKASDIPIAGFTEGTPAAPPQGKGATVAFTGAMNRRVGDTIIVLDTAAAAGTAADASVTAAKQQIGSPQVSSAPIGDGGTAVRGTAAAQSVAVLIWHTGRAVVVLEFQSGADDPVPTAVIQSVATKQQAKLAAGLPG